MLPRTQPDVKSKFTNYEDFERDNRLELHSESALVCRSRKTGATRGTRRGGVRTREINPYVVNRGTGKRMDELRSL